MILNGASYMPVKLLCLVFTSVLQGFCPVWRHFSRKRSEEQWTTRCDTWLILFRVPHVGCALSDMACSMQSVSHQPSCSGLALHLQPEVQPLAPKRCSGMERGPVMPRRTAARQPMDVQALRCHCGSRIPKLDPQPVDCGRSAAIVCPRGPGLQRAQTKQWLSALPPAKFAEISGSSAPDFLVMNRTASGDRS